ncbi:tetratricopeptide repeat protein [Piscinibacter sakaiensis]|uniref:Methyltransferase type 12 domain-containing protein n=1 Tax=Piscinibacter sakaiensis TaxID=1547922 RepID=A0A0K8P3S5_PISS1|nr:tetratricopeptide repeat protein [Piscinibacter sakaiensis]GAP37226.1 hypothetical protein ISF6_3081 [Piscinibacter sakaiensis]
MTDDARFAAARDAFLAGLAAFEAGEPAQAERHYRASLALLPGRASTLTNLAAALLAQQRPAPAHDAARAATVAEPAGADGWLNLGLAEMGLKRPQQALAAFERCVALAPGAAAGWWRRAEALEALGRVDAALESADQALARDPALGPAWNLRAGLLRETGRLAEAAEAYRQAAAHGADPALQAYYLGAVGAAPAPAHAPPDYVRRLFDGYAAGFDQHLVERLKYDAPQRLVAGLPPGATPVVPAALDLGCGTGLCGPLLRPLAQRLTGLDLSPAMLAQARARGVYDVLERADLLEALPGLPPQDLVLAADVFIYVGDLAPVFAALQQLVPAGGRFSFTLERDEAAGEAGYRLLPSLRYGHSEAGVRRLAAAHGWAVAALDAAPLREDQRQPVEGLFVHLRRGG